MAQISWERMELLFIDMNWLVQGVPMTKRRTNHNYTEYDTCYAILSDLKYKSNDDCAAIF